MEPSPRAVQPGRLLVTGASGFLGWHLCRLARHSWQVHGTFNQQPVQLAGVPMHRVDMTQPQYLQTWLQELAPTAVIHTAALAQPNRCEQQPELSYAINVEATERLGQFCGDRQIPLVFTSTDQVFDGRAAPYSEADTPNPINCYGRHKLEAEQRLRQVYPDAIIARMPLMYGPASPKAECFLQGFLRTLAAGQPLALFTDEYRSPAYVEDAALGLLLALEASLPLLHLGGPERISRYEFGLRMAAVFDLDPGLIVACHQANVPMPAARPADVSTVSRYALELGYRPRGVVAGLQTVRQWPVAPLKGL